jgi:sugar phosphate isomerase/epimerase
MNTLSVSSYSVREQLGPVKFDFVDPTGNPIHIDLPYPKLLELSDFPARARDAFGVEAIETVAFQFAGLDDPEIDRFGASLASSGVRLLDVAIDAGDLLEVDADKRAADIELITQWIRRFTAIGSEFVRVNPGSPFATHHGDGTPPTHLVDALGELGVTAREHGARLLVENHGGPSSNPQWMSALLDAVGRDHLGLLLDLGNFDALMGPMMAIFFGGPDGQPVDPATVFAGLDLSSLYTDIEALAARAELVHVKAHEVTDDGHVAPIDLVRALGILKAHDYAGPLTVEYEGNGGDPWAKSARVLEITKGVFA